MLTSGRLKAGGRTFDLEIRGELEPTLRILAGQTSDGSSPIRVNPCPSVVHRERSPRVVAFPLSAS
jgi:hypothetical protein